MDTAAAAAAMQAALEQKMADGRRGASLRQVKQIMVRMVKGEVGMRVDIWRTQLRMDTRARNAAMVSKLEAQVAEGKQCSGVVARRAVECAGATEAELMQRQQEVEQLRGEVAGVRSELEATKEVKQSPCT